VNTQKLMEAKSKLFAPAEELMEGIWKDHIQAIREAKPDVDELTLATTAICLENVRRKIMRLEETTRTSNIGSFIHYGFDMIAAVMPSLIAHEIVSVQPMSRRIGEVFFLEFLYGNTKGDIQANSKMFAYDVAGNSKIHYSDEWVYNESEGPVGSGDTTLTGVSAYTPVRPGTFTLYIGSKVITDNGQNVLVGDGSGTIDYVLGTYTANFAAPGAAYVATSTYKFNMEMNPSLIPQVILNISSLPVTANTRKIRSLFTLDAAFDIEQAFAKNTENELSIALASEVRQEIDSEIQADLLAFSQTGGADSESWPVTPPSGVSYRNHKFTLIDRLVKASNNIFKATRRAVGNYIIAGVDACTQIEQLESRFKPEGKVMPGPHYIGVLDGKWKVYKNPNFPALEMVMGYKGDLFLETCYVYAPYMPLYATQPIMLDDFTTRKGLATSYGTKSINPKFLCHFTVTA
jgi:hypothetical protein